MSNNVCYLLVLELRRRIYFEKRFSGKPWPPSSLFQPDGRLLAGRKGGHSYPHHCLPHSGGDGDNHGDHDDRGKRDHDHVLGDFNI